MSNTENAIDALETKMFNGDHTYSTRDEVEADREALTALTARLKREDEADEARMIAALEETELADLVDPFRRDF
jgi:hypothetical protein